MKQLFRYLIVVAFVTTFAAGALAAPAPPRATKKPAASATPKAAAAPKAPKEYVVDVTIVTPKNSRSGKVYVSGSSARTDTTDNKGRGIISIHNANANEFYLVFPKSKSYRVYKLDAVAKENNIEPVAPSEIKGERVGTETVAGQACDKLRYKAGGKAGFMWVNASSGLPVQMTSEDQKYKAQYSNPVVGPQAPSLFTPPADYKRIESSEAPKE